jgi:hypothetical protein
MSAPIINQIRAGQACAPSLELSEPTLRGADLRQTNLSGAKLRRVDLSGADLTGADLTGALIDHTVMFVDAIMASTAISNPAHPAFADAVWDEPDADALSTGGVA